MTTRADIETYLAGDIPTRISGFLTADAYAGQQKRINYSDVEVQVRWLAKLRIADDAGHSRHALTATVYVFGWDESEESNLADSLNDAVEAAVAYYDGNIVAVAAGVTGATITRVKTWSFEPVNASEYRKRERVLHFEIDEMEL